MFGGGCTPMRPPAASGPRPDGGRSWSETQIAARGLRDYDSQRLLKVERHRFVDSAYRKEAYFDYRFPSARGRLSPAVYRCPNDATCGYRSRRQGAGNRTGSGLPGSNLGGIGDSVFTIEIVARWSKG